jgi:uncharacterized protein YdaU (DUF1376 family)
MYYYKKNIGDYHKKAGRLSMLQHGAYTLLIDSCYDREVFPTLEDAIDWTWASTSEELDAVEFVLKRFFTLEDGLYVQNHIKEDLDKYHENSATNKRIAIEREAKRRKNSTKRAQFVNEPTPNQEPLTKEPLTKLKDMSPSAPVNQEKKVSKQFIKPTPEELVAHFESKGSNSNEAENFFNFYESKGWLVGKTKMKVWRASATLWISKNNNKAGFGQQTKSDMLLAGSSTQNAFTDQPLATMNQGFISND